MQKGAIFHKKWVQKGATIREKWVQKGANVLEKIEKYQHYVIIMTELITIWIEKYMKI